MSGGGAVGMFVHTLVITVEFVCVCIRVFGCPSPALLLAYMAGAGNLCRALLRNNAHPGIVNKQGVSIFNSPVATKKLLFRLLGRTSRFECHGTCCDAVRAVYFTYNIVGK